MRWSVAGYESLLLNSRQLELELDDVRLNLPWDGRSPRGLTRAAMSLFSSQEAQKSVSAFVDPEQGDLFKKAAPEQYSGAAPLLPLKRRRNGSSKAKW